MTNSIDHRLKSYIDKVIQNGTINQSYIFEGIDRAGKMELAGYLAKSLLCTADTSPRPCGRCHSCTLIERGSHPDCITLTHEAPKTISVKDIREQIIGDIDVRPFYGGRKIYIIPDAELMRKEGQNALLKTIEEPPEYGLIILLVRNRELLLETIRSRCVILSFRAEPLFHTDDEAVAEQFHRIEDIISGNAAYDMAGLMSYAKELSSEYAEYLPELLTHVELICRNALLEKSGMILTEKPETGYIEKTASISYEGLERMLDAVKKARHDMLLSVSTEAVMDALLLNIKQALAKPVS